MVGSREDRSWRTSQRGSRFSPTANPEKTKSSLRTEAASAPAINEISDQERYGAEDENGRIFAEDPAFGEKNHRARAEPSHGHDQEADDPQEQTKRAIH